MTGLSAVARSFWTLFLARMGVGVGEATLSPSAFSLIADYFPKERLATGGLVIQAVRELPAVDLPVFGAVASWRLTFLIVGVPGVLVSLLVYTIREPIRQQLLRTSDGRVFGFSILL
jgi:MFS family permease